MKKLLFALLFLASPVFAQTQTQYYTVPTIAALKAMTTSRPAVVQVVDANPGIFNLSSGACSAADDIFQVQPTGGTTVCYTRVATPYSVGKSATVNGVLVTSGTGVPSISATLPAVTAGAGLVTSTGSTTARSLANRFANEFYLEDFGGDTSASAATNTAAFAAAIAYFAPYGNGVTQAGATLRLKYGTYNVSTSVDMSGAHGLCIKGQGPLATSVKGSGNYPVFKSINTVSAPAGKQCVTDLHVESAPAAVVVGSISGTTFTISSVTSGTVTTGLVLAGAGGGILPDTTISSGSGLSWTVSASQTVANGTFTLIYPDAHGISLAYTNTGRIENTFITGSNHGIHNVGAWQLRILNNRFDGSPTSGDSVTNVCLYMGLPTDVLDAYHNNSVVATNNICQYPQSYGLRALEGAGSLFTSNQWLGGSSGVYLCDPGSATYVDATPVICQFMMFVNDQTDTVGGVGWKLKRGLASRMGPGIDIQSPWVGSSVGAAIQIENGEGIQITSMDIAKTDIGVNVVDSIRTRISGFIKNYNKNNNASAAVRLHNSTLSAVYITTDSTYALGSNGITESGTSADNTSPTASAPGYVGLANITNGKTLRVNNTLTLTAVDGSTLAIGAGGTLGSNAYTSTAYAPLASPTFTGTITTGGYTVAGLPAAPGTGARAYVTNQLTTCAVTGAALTGGGAVTCPVFYNGTAWVGG